MLKKIIKKEEFFYDVESKISTTGILKRGIYYRINFDTGYAWYDIKMVDITNFKAGDILEELYNK